MAHNLCCNAWGLLQPGIVLSLSSSRTRWYRNRQTASHRGITRPISCSSLTMRYNTRAPWTSSTTQEDTQQIDACHIKNVYLLDCTNSVLCNVDLIDEVQTMRKMARVEVSASIQSASIHVLVEFRENERAITSRTYKYILKHFIHKYA